MTGHLLAALAWDPQIRGALIVVTAFVILPGSVFLLLATDVGAKLGFLLAAAGLTGWMAVMGWVWVVYGIGIKGDQPTWKVDEIVTGSLTERGATEEGKTFPKGWQKLKAGDAIFGDATAAADKVLVPETSTPKEGETPAPLAFAPVFDEPIDYTLVAGYAKGGENYWLPGGGLASKSHVGNPGRNPIAKIVDRVERGPFHAPHYAVIQVAPVLEVTTPAGEAPPKPKPDPTKEVTSVVMVRDLGNLRFPSLMVAISMSIVFAIIANALHRRDKEIMAARRAAPAIA
ncbi:MAG TPA: hypothetical protein VM143_16115 [Acidimicrobiales bacterium]|nr:hypothetical protein [Acidimicrobiales bacterium]